MGQDNLEWGKFLRLNFSENIGMWKAEKKLTRESREVNVFKKGGGIQGSRIERNGGSGNVTKIGVRRRKLLGTWRVRCFSELCNLGQKIKGVVKMYE